jgi:hypothetical protein
MPCTIWTKEAGFNWRKLPGVYGCWENKDSAIEYARGIMAGYVEVTVENCLGRVEWRSPGI